MPTSLLGHKAEPENFMLLYLMWCSLKGKRSAHNTDAVFKTSLWGVFAL